MSRLQYDGEICVEVNGNKPDFSEEEISYAREQKNGYEQYSNLDRLGRCGTAMACLCEETRPEYGEKRGDISKVYPSGWQSVNFWSRCHLIGWQLSAENDNDRNLITGTAYMNVSGMLPFENIVAEYLSDNKDKHVLYKVEPVFRDKELVARGVEMQAMSLEDNGESVSYHIYVFNYQPGYIIDYKDGTIGDDPDHQTVITLQDKHTKYTGRVIEIDDAKVEGSTGTVRYIYYYDSDCKNKMSSPPVARGTYYVKAVVSGDNRYPTATSETAQLTIY